VNVWLDGSRATISEFMGIHTSITGSCDKLGGLGNLEWWSVTTGIAIGANTGP